VLHLITWNASFNFGNAPVCCVFACACARKPVCLPPAFNLPYVVTQAYFAQAGHVSHANAQAGHVITGFSQAYVAMSSPRHVHLRDHARLLGAASLPALGRLLLQVQVACYTHCSAHGVATSAATFCRSNGQASGLRIPHISRDALCACLCAVCVRACAHVRVHQHRCQLSSPFSQLLSLRCGRVGVMTLTMVAVGVITLTMVTRVSVMGVGHMEASKRDAPMPA